jgi:predicted GNAT superfamily acetyltransferase
MSRLQIRALHRLEEFHECERIQRVVWGNVGVGSEVLAVTAKHGGAVLGAVVDGRIVGCLYAFLARRRGRLIHWSHIMAVEPPYRDRGLGFQMKLAHRRLALQQGLRSICWTYDPLQSRNAALNIARLGAQVEEYIPDCYGRFTSSIEKSLPSDRFVVNWRIASPSVELRLRRGVPPCRTDFSLLPRVNETQVNAKGFLENRTISLSLRARRVLVEIPPNTDAMRAQDLKLAWRWRTDTRRIFQHYFAAGYQVEDFLLPTLEGSRKCFYLLHRQKLALTARGSTMVSPGGSCCRLQ